MRIMQEKELGCVLQGMERARKRPHPREEGKGRGTKVSESRTEERLRVLRE